MPIDLPPRGVQHAPNPVKLTPDQLEELLAGDDLEPAVRRNLESKLEAIRATEDRAARAAAQTPREIVDSIPRHFR